MPIHTPADLKQRLIPGQRLMGLDVGTRTIGLALSDTRLLIASPLDTIRRGRRFRDDAALLKALIEKHGVGALVIGWPMAMDGSEGPRCQSVRQFAKNLDEVIPLPTAFW